MNVRTAFKVSGAPFAIVIKEPDEEERAAMVDPSRWVLKLWEQIRKRKRRDPKVYEYLWQGFSSIAPRLAMRIPGPGVSEGFFPSWENLEQAKRDVSAVLERAGAEWDGFWERE